MNPREIAQARSHGLLLRRWAGAWVDFLAGYGIMILVAEVLFPGRRLPPILAGDIVLLGAYFIGLEVLLGGTLGKLVTGTRVVDAEGKRPNFKAAAIRTVLRLVEVNPLLLGGIPAALIVNFSKTKQRLGDMAAGTYVLTRRELSGVSAKPS